MPPEKNEDQRKETQERQIWAKNKGLLNRQSDLVPRVHKRCAGGQGRPPGGTEEGISTPRGPGLALRPSQLHDPVTPGGHLGFQATELLLSRVQFCPNTIIQDPVS